VDVLIGSLEIRFEFRGRPRFRGSASWNATGSGVELTEVVTIGVSGSLNSEFKLWRPLSGLSGLTFAELVDRLVVVVESGVLSNVSCLLTLLPVVLAAVSPITSLNERGLTELRRW
jgi:hypothetical protein